jgi:hypothetical protein
MPVAPSRPSLTKVANQVHATIPPDRRSYLVVVDAGTRHADVGTWAVPAAVGEPLTCLIGFTPAPGWNVVGWSTPDVTDPTSPRTTTLVDRLGRGTTTVDDGTVPSLAATPDPLVGDLLARCLGLLTAPPTSSPAAWLDSSWLDRVAAVAFDATTSLAWPDLAALHPFGPIDGEASPGHLRSRTGRLDDPRRWTSVRRRWLGRTRPHPPGPGPAEERTWFDDGSFSRWLQRGMPPVDAVLRDLEVVLPERLVADVNAALATVVAA